MPDIEYTTEDLRSGGRHASDAGGSAVSAAVRLHGADRGSPYGDVIGSQILHDTVTRAREHHSSVLAAAAGDLDELSGRAARAAVLGDTGTAETTRLANPSPSAASMGEGR